MKNTFKALALSTITILSLLSTQEVKAQFNPAAIEKLGEELLNEDKMHNWESIADGYVEQIPDCERRQAFIGEVVTYVGQMNPELFGWLDFYSTEMACQLPFKQAAVQPAQPAQAPQQTQQVQQAPQQEVTGDTRLTKEQAKQQVQPYIQKNKLPLPDIKDLYVVKVPDMPEFDGTLPQRYAKAKDWQEKQRIDLYKSLPEVKEIQDVKIPHAKELAEWFATNWEFFPTDKWQYSGASGNQVHALQSRCFSQVVRDKILCFMHPTRSLNYTNEYDRMFENQVDKFLGKKFFVTEPMYSAGKEILSAEELMVLEVGMCTSPGGTWSSCYGGYLFENRVRHLQGYAQTKFNWYNFINVINKIYNSPAYTETSTNILRDRALGYK